MISFESVELDRTVSWVVIIDDYVTKYIGTGAEGKL